MNLTPNVLFARGLRCRSDTPPQTPTNTQRYNLFRLRAPAPLRNAYPWKWHRRK